MQEKEFGDQVIDLDRKIKVLAENLNEKQSFISNELRVLKVINDRKLISPTSLVMAVGIVKSNLNIISKKMIESGYISKSTDSFDGRIIYYSITDSGRKHLKEASQKIEKNIKAKLDSDEIEKFNKAVVALLQSINKI